MEITPTFLSGPDTYAVREDLLSFMVTELCDRISRILACTYNLHIRWMSPELHPTKTPFVSRIPPGLHILISPIPDEALPDLCPLLLLFFGETDCSSMETTFIRLPLGVDFGLNTTWFQFYSPMLNLDMLARIAENEWCHAQEACLSLARKLHTAWSLDLSYNHESAILKAAVISPPHIQTLSVAVAASSRTEVGILAPDRPSTLQKQEEGVAGMLVILGEKASPSPTRFAFTPKHRRADGFFASEILPHTGFHPVLQLKLKLSIPPVDSNNCILYAYLSLPKYIFGDRYQLLDPLFLQANNISKLHFISGAAELEAPNYSLSNWGSSLLFQLAPHTQSLEYKAAFLQDIWAAEIPLHFRYLQPNTRGYEKIIVPQPIVFWACPLASNTSIRKNPFELSHIEYNGLFDQRTIFWHVDPIEIMESLNHTSLFHTITVPVAFISQTNLVGIVTIIIVFLGLIWITYNLHKACFPSKTELGEGKAIVKQKFL